MNGIARVDDAVCLGCGCLCDDITLHVDSGRILRAERACPIGERWFLAERHADQPAGTIAGRPAELEAACKRAAEILGRATSPLVMGLGSATCEAQRLAVALADRLGAAIDAGNANSAAVTTAIQQVGMVTATLGEVRHRAELVMFWGVDPATTHPRHFERYSLTCAGEFVPNGRTDRVCIVVDSHRTPTADAADVFLQIKAGADAVALGVLRAFAAGDDVPAEADVLGRTGVALAEWEALTERMKSARYGCVFFDSFKAADPNSSSADAFESLFKLVANVNRHTRFVALPLGSPANPVGAEQVLTWQTGCSSPASFAAGYPERDPAQLTAAARLTGGACDAVLVVASNSLIDSVAALPESARTRLTQIPCIVLHTSEFAPPAGAVVTITVATPGIQAGGTVFRCDNVPLPLRPAVETHLPTTEAVLRQLQQSIVHANRGATSA